jgi:hypothetical protein
VVEAERERLNSPSALHEWLIEQDLIADDVELSAADLWCQGATCGTRERSRRAYQRRRAKA